MASGQAGAFVLYDEHLEKMREASRKEALSLRLSLDKFLEASGWWHCQKLKNMITIKKLI